MNILVCATGLVAAIKTLIIVEMLKLTHEVQFAVTKSGKFFIDQHYKVGLPQMIQDSDEWVDAYQLGEPVLHIDLRAWVGILLIVPCSSNTLAKLAYGVADNLVTCVARAWDYFKLVFIALAMNTSLWEYPFTKEHCACLGSIGACIINPIEKTLVCGDRGIGAMENSDVIAYQINLSARSCNNSL